MAMAGLLLSCTQLMMDMTNGYILDGHDGDDGDEGEHGARHGHGVGGPRGATNNGEASEEEEGNGGEVGEFIDPLLCIQGCSHGAKRRALWALRRIQGGLSHPSPMDQRERHKARFDT